MDHTAFVGDPGHSALVIGLTVITFTGSAGLAALVMASERATAAERPLRCARYSDLRWPHRVEHPHSRFAFPGGVVDVFSVDEMNSR
ncbi:hypothetical protein [Actinokineospora sp. NBRC 105648]|uniref:hypothetical protein n=1 Tax=Actinokineospora sp. NBRC 105648 TaxID=3032206 RepID=UPI0025546D92|nr:hypothetical protein [Actinokineospora sp. NBRC 105648]